MKLCWASDYWVGAGNAYGYSVHSRMMKEHTARLIELNDDAPMALHIQSGDNFRPIGGKKNLLFTMFEANQLPAVWLPRIRQADVLIVPCEHNKRVFRKYYDREIYVCHEGVDLEVFPYMERNERASPFVFLWVGAPNPRKGLNYLTTAWTKSEFWINPKFLLYLKMTPPPPLVGKEKILEVAKARKWVRGGMEYLEDAATREEMRERVEIVGGNIIVDTRKLPIETLSKLYQSANCFVLPSKGEGFGLTLAEAMATGAPCIATSWSGTADFFDRKVGYPIKFEVKGTRIGQYAQFFADTAEPDVEDIRRLMRLVVDDYRKAMQKGKAAHERIKNGFTWPRAARRLVEILKEVKGNGAN